MKDKTEFAKNVENILKLNKCRLTILHRGARAARLSRKTVKCFARIATAERAMFNCVLPITFQYLFAD